MQKKILIIFLITCCHLVYGQSAIRGDVKDKNGQMIKGASITVKNSYDGAVTDEKGIFSFSISGSGTLTIEAEAMGYITQSVQLDSLKVIGNPLILHFCLMETMNQLDAVAVTVSAFGGGQGKKGVVVLSSLDVLTTAGANADISKAVNLLPGAQQISNKEGLFVRGGTGYETKQFIDGAMVPHPYYLGADNIPGRGRYSATLFKGFSFNTGGYSALYGQALSSVLTMETIDMPERSEANAFISPIQNSLGFQSLSENKKFSWGMNYQYTNVGLYYKLVKQAARYFKYPAFHNAEANFRVKTKRGILKFYSSFNYNGLGLARPGVDSVNTYLANSIEDYNWWNNLQWKTGLGKGWQLTFNAAFSFNRSHIVAQLQDKNAKPVSTGAAWIDTLN
ncbi:MAG TPA: carboxypeptidase-like regulatory domain-containing protein, partial [Arachidicoccus sp.]|nr:carboxypeptidase-like regulatory domain-containing protein [Arachidicoccus sp.]